VPWPYAEDRSTTCAVRALYIYVAMHEKSCKFQSNLLDLLMAVMAANFLLLKIIVLLHARSLTLTSFSPPTK
jgi:hypothetical protein